ncbi:MAG: CDP-alcohol phosphatidyltransferase family protein [Planctomycetes bacterium]|nr:CDP-alcohol phosphatidyltransferase family protein [Planctomycetota bacterium]
MYLFPSWRKKRYAFLKRNDVWWAVLVLNLFAVPGTIIADKLGKHLRVITPNGISVTSFVFFFLGVTLLFIRPHNNAYFTLCFFFGSVLDAMDGQLARLRGETSQLGVIVDAFFDMLNHSLGLMLVGVALSIKVDSPYPLIIILPYSLYLGVMHINCITNAVYPPPKQEVSDETNNRTKWQLFCDKRGLGYNIYTDVEVICVVILLIGVNLQNPAMFLFVGIYSKFVLTVLKKIREELALWNLRKAL